MNWLEKQAKEFMERRNMSTITATEYQEKAAETAIFPKQKALEYITLGLTGEATLEQKKIEIGYELGDVLWYCAMLAREVDINLGHVMEKNIEKLHSRKERGTLGGSGDNR
jgi:NTP pyrophosphatase (non-canonical NTP hydrolase)